MSDEVKDGMVELGKATTALREYVERQEAEIKKVGAAMPETKDALDKITARLDNLEMKAARPKASENKDDENTPERKAFSTFLRRGAEGLGEEAKALSVSDDTAGGYTVIPQVQNTIVEYLVEYSPVREVATVVPITTAQLDWPKETATAAGGWTAEEGARTETTGETFGKVTIPAHEMYAWPYVTRQLLEDSAFNIEAFLSRKAAMWLGKLEGTAFISGTGVGSPEGIMTNADVGHTHQGEASTLTSGDGIIKLIHDLQEEYARNGRFLMSRATLGIVRMLKGGDGQYIWWPDYTGSNPPSIQGYPYTQCVDMPAVTTNTYPIVFGDFARAYCIADRTQISLLRDPYSSASAGAVRFMFFKRVGGKVVNAAAIRKLLIAA
jgi:HK97 family phage major capsid protein